MTLPKPYWEESAGQLYLGDCLETMRDMPDNSIDLMFTSPPYPGVDSKYIGIEISRDYCSIAAQRLGQEVLF